MNLDELQIGQIVWTPLGRAWVVAIHVDDDIVQVWVNGHIGFHHPESLLPL